MDDSLFRDVTCAAPATAQAIFASGGGSGEKKDDVDKAVEALVEGARKYRRKYKRPPVLVLDDVDRFASRKPRCSLVSSVQASTKRCHGAMA